MSYQINYINDIEQFNDGQVDNEQYFLFNGQWPTPQGDENDININNLLPNINNDVLDHSINNINNIDNFMENEYSAAPVPLRRREADIPNNNAFLNNNVDIIENIDNNNQYNNENNIDNSLIVSNNLFQDNIKDNGERIYDEEKYLNQPFVHNDFSCFNPNFIDNDKDNYLIIEENNNENTNIISLNKDNNEEKSNINIYVERITPFPGMNENNNIKNSENYQNINIMDAPINNALSNSSSQNTNSASLSSIHNNDNSAKKQYSLISSRTIIPNSLEKNINAFEPGKKREEIITQSKKFDDSVKTTGKKNKKKKFLRKFKPDSLRKKIKARMHKKIRDKINKNLKECGSKMLFDYLPQPFITNVNVIQNKAYLKLTMRTLFKMVFGNKSKDKEKVKTNLKVLSYLDSNIEIRVKSGVDDFLKSTYEDIIREYVNGKLFEEDVKKLYKEEETKEYIDKYEFIGRHLIEFYNNNGKILNV